MFEFVCKKVKFFETVCKLTVKVLPCFACKPIGTPNQDPRPLLDSFQCHESNDGLRFGKRAPVENHIFRSKLNCLYLREI